MKIPDDYEKTNSSVIKRKKKKIIIKHIIAENIRLFRIRRGLTQKQLADKLDLSTTSITTWESGRLTPEISRLVEISEILGITLDQLVLQVHELELKKGEHL